MSDAVLGPCPQTEEEMNNYDAIVMDEHGYVDVTISGVRFTQDEGFRSRRILLEEEVEDGDGDGKNEDREGEEEEQENQTQEEENEEEQEENPKNNSEDHPNGVEEEDQIPASENTKATTENKKTKSTNKKNIGLKSHIQVYLVSLDINKEDVPTDEESAYIPYLDFLSDGNGLCCYEYLLSVKGGNEYGKFDNILQKCTSPELDMRPMVPRIGRNQKLSPPLAVSTSMTDVTDSSTEAVVSARFRPLARGRHMVVISNCAAELAEGQVKKFAHPVIAHFEKVEFKFISKFGELPLSMMGIVPFYGLMLILYAMLGLIWFRRSKGIVGCQRWGTKYKSDDGTVRNVCGAKPRQRRKGNNPINGDVGFLGNIATVHAPPLLGLQRAIYSLVLLQLAFTAVAFTYYLHLNVAVVDIDILYGGTMAALASWTPFSALVALVHFATFLSCQAVVMLATDGTWLIQSTIRPDTKKAICILGSGWAFFFVAYAFISRQTRLVISVILGVTWVAFLLFNVRRSLRHLRTLMVGASNDTVMAAGGALVAKRSMYRKMCAVVAIYPLIFIAGVLWNAEVSYFVGIINNVQFTVSS